MNARAREQETAAPLASRYAGRTVIGIGAHPDDLEIGLGGVHNACLPVQRRGAFDFFSYHPTNCYPVPVNFHPRAYVDISDTIDAKMHSITAHASQFQGRGLDTEIYREFAHVQGRFVGAGYAEGVDVMRMLLA